MQAEFMATVLSDISDIPFYEYNKEGDMVRLYCHHSDDLIFPNYLQKEINQLIPELELNDFGFATIRQLPVAICMYRDGSGDKYYLWGPIKYRPLSFFEENQLVKIEKKSKHQIELFDCGIRRLLGEVSCFISVLTNQVVSAESLQEKIDKHGLNNSVNEEQSPSASHLPIKDEEKIKYRIKREDDHLVNHTYVEEQVLWDVIRIGDVDRMRKFLDYPAPKAPLVIDGDVLKNEEYMTVSTIAIISRTAIESGVTSSESFLLSDLYLKRISKCKKISDYKRLSREACLAFTELVKEYKDKKTSNNYVEDCKKDIEKNLFNKISLKDIAADLQIRPSYLSRLFSEHEGMTVVEYIHTVKIREAENMLKFSDRTGAEIADYLKFSSQSYFGRVFKKVTHMTPKEYRNYYHPPEF